MPPRGPQTLGDLAPNCLAPGDILDGRYRIEHVLGEGTFAWVYLARHATIDTLQCAIKVLKPHFVGDDELRQQFRQEAETVARLRDRHTVRVSDLGELPDGRPYICMEYCVGATLDKIIARRGPLPEIMVAHIARGVLHSLREAHDLGIVHRDIKPSNISLTEDPSSSVPLARVLDFGIAYVAQMQGVGGANDESDLVFCTPSYAAPEVLRGEITDGADFYALGLTMAELLDGAPVFVNTGFYTVAARQMADEPVPFGPVALKSKLLPFLQVACEKNLNRRFQSAGEMLEALDEVIDELEHEEMLTWSYFMPPDCVGVDRCSLASSRLDMALPAGCAHHCAGSASKGPELRIRSERGMQPSDVEFEALQNALNELDSLEDFKNGEFSDLDDAGGAENLGTDDFVRRSLQTSQHTQSAAESGDAATVRVHQHSTGTVRAHRFDAGDLTDSTHQVSPSRAGSVPRAGDTLTARYEAGLQRAMRALVPSQPRLEKHALLIGNVFVALALFTLLTVLLLRGLPF